ncbi:MAG: hypothetical protein V3S89_02160 [Desulfobacterales bacterium]
MLYRARLGEEALRVLVRIYRQDFAKVDSVEADLETAIDAIANVLGQILRNCIALMDNLAFGFPWASADASSNPPRPSIL